MTESVVQDSPLKQLPGRVMVAGRLTSIGAKALDDIESGRQLPSLFLAGTGVGKTTAPEIGCAMGPSAHAADVLKDPENKQTQELK